MSKIPVNPMCKVFKIQIKIIHLLHSIYQYLLRIL